MYKLDSFDEQTCYALIVGPRQYRCRFSCAAEDEVEDILKPLNEAFLVSLAASIRYNKEVSGIVVEGLEIKTDRESQSQLTAAYHSLSSGLISETDWKATNGWVTVSLLELEPIATAVVNHVRKCFFAERKVCDLIKSKETNAELASMNIEEEFNNFYNMEV